MSAGKYCNREVIVSEKGTSVIEAAKLMRRHHVGDLVIVEQREGKNHPIGIVTDRDLVVEVLAQDVSHESIILEDIMSTELVIVQEDELLLDVLEKMRVNGVRRIPVINKRDELQGILTADDVIELLSEITTNLTKMHKIERTHEVKKTRVVV